MVQSPTEPNPPDPLATDLISPRKLVDRLYAAFHEEAARQKVQLRFNLSQHLPDRVRVPAARLEQTLINLMGFAVSATPNGSVSLTCLFKNGRLTIAIADTSAGLPPDVIERLRTNDPAVANDWERSLKEARQRCQAANGFLEVKSEKRMGNVLTISLPAEASPDPEVEMSPGERMVNRWLDRYRHNSDLKAVFYKGLRHLREEVESLQQVIEEDRRYELAGMLHSMKAFPGGFGMTEVYTLLKKMEAAVHETPFTVERVKPYLAELSGIINTIPPAVLQQEPDRAGATGKGSPVDKKAGITRKILVAEDDRMNREMIAYILQDLGFSFAMVSNGAEVLSKLSGETFDLLLLDMQMPVMDGIETLRRIRRDQRLRHLPVIGVSADIQTEERRCFQQAGCNAVMEKPLSVAGVSSMMTQLLGQAGTTRNDP